jgi:hypothetical protein
MSLMHVQKRALAAEQEIGVAHAMAHVMVHDNAAAASRHRALIESAHQQEVAKLRQERDAMSRRLSNMSSSLQTSQVCSQCRNHRRARNCVCTVTLACALLRASLARSP